MKTTIIEKRKGDHKRQASVTSKVSTQDLTSICEVTEFILGPGKHFGVKRTELRINKLHLLQPAVTE